MREALIDAVINLKKVGFEISDDTIRSFGFDSTDIEIKEAKGKDAMLIDMACRLLLNTTVSASNGGGGFENVHVEECMGIMYNSYNNRKEVKFRVDDDWIGNIYYSEEQILKMWEEKKEKKRPRDTIKLEVVEVSCVNGKLKQENKTLNCKLPS